MATITILSGQTLSGTTLFNGTTSVGTITLSPGDTLAVNKGGTAEALTVTNETVNVSTGGTTSNLVISSGGIETLVGSATAFNASVLSGGVVSETGNLFHNSGLFIGSGGFLAISGSTATQNDPVTVVAGGQVEFAGISAQGVLSTSSRGGNTTLTVTRGTAHESVVLAGTGRTFTSSTIGTSAPRAVFTITCFASGTQILTATDEVPIDAIQPGDTVAVRRGGEMVLESVTWVGKSRINLSRHARPELAAPIRVKVGALAANTPTRDLLLSPEHCLIIGGRCVPVKLLINGGSIAREYPAEPFEYYHLELEKHGILIADGAEAESYLDTGNRSSFDNAEMPRLLHPTFQVNATADLWNTHACVPLASVEAEVAPIWQMLADRSAALGYVVPVPTMVEGPDLHILADGRHFQPVSDHDSRYVFAIPAGVKSVSLVSRFCIPADKMVSSQRDTRRLGVSVNWIAIRSDGDEAIMSADHPGLCEGWNDAEQAGTSLWRWTDGAAAIPWDNITGPAVLTVRCSALDRYPVYNETLALVA
jgi:antigen 43